MRKIALALLSTFALLGIPPVHAGENDKAESDKTEASRHFRRALELVDDGQMAEALIEFQRSYELKPQFQVLFNIAQAHIALAQPVDAVAAFERYLADGGTQVSKARRKEVEAELERQRARIATLNVEVGPVEARLHVDDKDHGAVSPGAAVVVRVGVGRHRLTATAEGYLAADTQVTVAGEDRRDIRLLLEKVPPRDVVPMTPPRPPAPPVVAPASALHEPAPAPPAPAPQPTHVMRALSYGLAGAGLVGLAGSGLLWLRAVDKHDQAQSLCNDVAVCPGEANRLQSEAKTAATWSSVTGVTGAALVGAGVALYFLFPTDSWQRHAMLLPLVEHQAAGLAARGAF